MNHILWVRSHWRLLLKDTKSIFRKSFFYQKKYILSAIWIFTFITYYLIFYINVFRLCRSLSESMWDKSINKQMSQNERQLYIPSNIIMMPNRKYTTLNSKKNSRSIFVQLYQNIYLSTARWVCVWHLEKILND